MTRLVRGTVRDDEGMTLVELLITMVIMGVVGIIVTSAMVNQNKLFRSTEDQSAGLQDVRVASERLGRDVRDARAVLCNPAGTPAALLTDTSCQSHLQVWIDYNSDYKQQADETVTWWLRLRVAGCTGTCYYDLVRSVGTSTAIVEAHTIISNVAFAYSPVAPGSTQPTPGATTTNQVETLMQYDARKTVGDGTAQRTVHFTARLRNVS
jgi:prepilin-type N-terminal cleavage/methylation domain-containing protein